MSDALTYELDGSVALIGLNRPQKRNAIDDGLIEALRLAVARAATEAKAGIVFGHGEHFSAGLDLAEHVVRTPIEGIHHSRMWHRVFDTIARGAVPYVSALHGAVVGGGGSVRIARLVSAARMADMMLTGRVLSAADGERCNFVQYLVPRGEALAKARELAARIARNAPLSNFSVINALPRIQDLSHDDGLFLEALMTAMTQTSPEAQERLREFLDKRAERLAVPAPAKDGDA